METNQKIIVICGPTASGKTGLALQLAKALPKVNILSVDSRQVYKSLDIISGKDIPDSLPKGINIFGHDLFEPDETANLADFVRYSQKIIQNSKDTNTPLVIVGGTGLYLKAITQNLSNILIPPNQKLRQKLEKLSLSELQGLLQKENPEKFSSLNHSDIMNPRRLIRQIEISESHSGLDPESIFKHCNEVTSEYKRKHKCLVKITQLSTKHEQALIQVTPFSEVNFRWIGLMPDKNTLKTNIKNRVIKRIDEGAIDEVNRLIKNYPDHTLPIYTGLGVSQIINFLSGNITKNQLVEQWTNAEADYARRQIVWFKKQNDIVWYDKDIDRNLLIKELKKYFQNA